MVQGWKMAEKASRLFGVCDAMTETHINQSINKKFRHEIMILKKKFPFKNIENNPIYHSHRAFTMNKLLQCRRSNEVKKINTLENQKILDLMRKTIRE